MKELELLPVSRLLPHPDNPRKDLGDLSELTESVRTQGILQNLTVVPADLVPFVQIPDPQQAWYVVIIGHRRLAAATAAGLETVPCVVAGMNRKEQLSTMLCENVQRSELTVYEQAQGFHQLALLGCNVAEISKRSGFSSKTVKQRIEMAKLDQKTLKEVSTGRQLSLGDFVKLEQLKDMATRNRVLKTIGTRDFDEALAKAKKKELVDANRPMLRKWLQDHDAKELDEKNRYSGRYTSTINNHYYNWIDIANMGNPGDTLPSDEDIQGRQLYYVMFEANVSFYVEIPNSTARTIKGKKTEAEKARDRVIKEVRARIRELTAIHYELRKGFVEQLTVTSSNRDKIVAGALMPALYFAGSYGGHHSDTMRDALGMGKNDYGEEKLMDALGRLTDKELPRVVYAIYNDKAENWFADGVETPGTIPSFPKLTAGNILLKMLYDWLISLGYEPSTEEQALRDGSHEIYQHAREK